MATAAQFRRIALSLPNVEQGSHHGQPDFRTGGHCFATLSMADQGYGNLMLTPEVQSEFVADAPEIFIPIKGGWGRMGHTHLVLATADEATIRGALQTAYNLRLAKNAAAKTNARKRR
ncbi:MAG TPA: MmcQ/YjbR family DNA-binding protein [Candidatus Aquilonibacter sp.]|nr:MmcQ/YjbR family DNA-binding protein [Candidatus Aquilonibacter sp.]